MLVYFPDARVEFHDGRVEIREIKDVYDAERDPDYDEKIGYAREIYDGDRMGLRRFWSAATSRRSRGLPESRKTSNSIGTRVHGFDMSEAFSTIER